MISLSKLTKSDTSSISFSESFCRQVDAVSSAYSRCLQMIGYFSQVYNPLVFLNILECEILTRSYGKTQNKIHMVNNLCMVLFILWTLFHNKQSFLSFQHFCVVIKVTTVPDSVE